MSSPTPMSMLCGSAPPSSFHAEQIKACAENGKHVFCEKPLATDLAETVETINACNEAGVKLMTGLQRRFDPNFRRVKQAIEDQEVGETIMIKLCSRDPSPPPFEYVKGGGGIFADMAVHDLDMSCFFGEVIFDEEVHEIEAEDVDIDIGSVITSRGIIPLLFQ